jgi:hypothetical protein
VLAPPTILTTRRRLWGLLRRLLLLPTHFLFLLLGTFFLALCHRAFLQLISSASLDAPLYRVCDHAATTSAARLASPSPSARSSASPGELGYCLDEEALLINCAAVFVGWMLTLHYLYTRMYHVSFPSIHVWVHLPRAALFVLLFKYFELCRFWAATCSVSCLLISLCSSLASGVSEKRCVPPCAPSSGCPSLPPWCSICSAGCWASTCRCCSASFRRMVPL